MTIPRNEHDVDNFLVFGCVNTFRYTNWKGETEMRKIVPICLRFGVSEHHKASYDLNVHEDEQGGGIWLLEAFDMDKQALRTFALKDIHPR
jgi:predicted DNA-binding transcriptional regulator YafY